MISVYMPLVQTGMSSAPMDHSPEAIAKWAYSLRDRFGGHIAICLELAEGPLVYALQRYEFLVLFKVHPSTLAEYRKAFVPSGAKDDPTDAEAALDILLRHPEKLQPIKLQSVAMRNVATLVEERRWLADDVTRITNRLVSTLKQYYPQVLGWFEHRDTLIFCDFLERWPTLKHAKRARKSTLESFFHQHNARRAYLVEKRIQGIRAATALTEDEGVIRPYQMVVQALVEQLRPLLQSIDRFDAEIDDITKSLPDYDIFAALPGAETSRLPDCWLPLARIEIAMQMHHRYSATRELPRYSSAAATSVGPLAPLLSHFPAPDVCRMGGLNHTEILLGRRLLSAATQERLLSSGRGSSLGVQVDQDNLSLLEDTDSL